MATVEKRFTRPTTITKVKEVKHLETGSPFDRTVALSAAVLAPGLLSAPRSPSRSPTRGGSAMGGGAAGGGGRGGGGEGGGSSEGFGAETAGDVNAFRTGRVTSKKSPSRFLLAHSGFGGSATAAMDVKTGAVAEAPLSPPPKAGATKARTNPPNTELRRFYERGDLPCVIDQRGVHNKLAWKYKVEDLDFHLYLPLFFDGLREEEMPYKFIAREGVLDMLELGGTKIVMVIPQLIIPIKNALNTRRHDVMCLMLKVLQKLVTADVGIEGGDLIGRALVPYYRQILPVLNIFYNKNRNLGDGIDYSQRKEDNLGDLIHETLQLFETYGGSEALINIKYLVPTYEPCMLP